MSGSAFGARLSELRSAHGYTQQYVADQCNCDNSKISRLEAGRANPTPEDAVALDHLFGTAPELARLAEQYRPRQRQPKQPIRSELPPAPAYLLGRDVELGRVIRHLDRSDRHPDSRIVRVCLVHGLPGFGKTALATYAADRLRRQYGDGQFYLDLQGYASGQGPVPVSTALDTLLRRLGVTGDKIPATGEDDLVAELRSQIGSRRLLVLVENARNATDVNRLISALPGCAVIVTSRSRLTIDDACRVELTSLHEDDADRLFQVTSSSDEAQQGDDDTAALVRSIVTLCYRNPFAIRVVAGRFRDNPTVSLQYLAQTLVDARTRFTAIADGERNLMSPLRTSHALLSERQRDAITMLAAHPGIRIDPYSASALIGVSPEAAGELLRDLFQACMLEPHSVNAYQFHDLIRDFLRHDKPLANPPEATRNTLTRLFDYYLRNAADADQTIEPHRYQLDLDLLPDPVAVHEFPTKGDATEWLRGEQVNLLSICQAMTAHGFHETCWQFCYYLRAYFFRNKQWSAWSEVYIVGAEAARRAEDRRAEGMMLNNAGVALAAAGDAAGAADCHRSAVEASAAAGDEPGVVTGRAHWGWALHLLGRHEEAYALTNSALEFYRKAEYRDWNVATTLESLAHIELRRGKTAEAERHLAEAHTLFVDKLKLAEYAETMVAQFAEAKNTISTLA
jgi:transcriptional regulator with XRE-family HTH domain/tetratricopeptide (TPR) repeat protein